MRKSISRVLQNTKIKKGIAVMATMAMMVGTLTACGNGTGSSKGEFDASEEITVVSREDGSGTRGAFIELFDIEEKGTDGTRIDHTTDDASVVNNTATMMTTVANSEYAIGYISLGSLNTTIKAVKVDGVDATAENAKNGTYKAVRPFNIVTKSDVNVVTKDFINFILSADGQKVVSDNHYITLETSTAYTSSNVSGKIVVSGSSSVSPVMEKLKEAYEALNEKVTIEIQTSDSSTGVSSTIDGTCDIGMASRELKDSEIEKGVTSTVIAQDGIAVIVNNDSVVTDLTSAQIQSIFTGEVTTWDEITE